MSLTAELAGGDVLDRNERTKLGEFVTPELPETDRRVVGAAALNLKPFGAAQGIPLPEMPRGTGHGTGAKGGGNFDDYDTE